jgi:hypothetical protein
MQIQNPMMFVRSIKGAPSSVLWVLVLVRQALTVNQLCAYTGFKPDAVRDAVNVLKGYELVVENKRAHGEAIYSIGKGYQCLLPGIDPEVLGRIEQQAIPESVLNGFCPEDQQEKGAEETIQSPFKSNSEPEKGGFSGQNPIKTDSGTGSIMIDDDDSINQNKEIHHQSEPEKILKLEVVLKNLTILFGDDLTVDEVPKETSAELALAWAAKLFKDFKRPGSTLRNPIGTLRLRLNAKTPRKLHLDNLPDEFLEAIGLKVTRCPSPSVFDIGSKMDADGNSVLIEDPGDETMPHLDNPVINRAWESVLGQLQMEMPRASFESWVQFTAPCAWNEADRLLSIAARNAYARDWLESRLESTVERLLAGILNGAVTVKFVVEEE